eukprot:CAMPEP_0172594602 /NCGR_PEP_ID=MMETSP1068-20121228/14034_1 /TAXON_ID=35684 /ORGANISM="Pseudopedinella elastica, Strain CCMP716" /LENGTH=32 /DNA_ID= /DNA_START= /DNA_END= /DNA_ORIENTATION=
MKAHWGVRALHARVFGLLRRCQSARGDDRQGH